MCLCRVTDCMNKQNLKENVPPLGSSIPAILVKPPVKVKLRAIHVRTYKLQLKLQNIKLAFNSPNQYYSAGIKL